MLEISERAQSSEAFVLTLRLAFEQRQRSRARVTLSSGEQALMLLPRGNVLRGGDLLKLSDGRVVRVEAAPETVSTVSTVLTVSTDEHSDAARALARAAYHLGNRHVALEIGAGFLRYLHDHVLDAMVCELGLTVRVESAPFEPESGAYSRHAHAPHSESGDHEHA